MILVLGFVALFILLCIGGIHFYWAMGGSWGFDQALPTMENGTRLFTPKKIHSALVGIGMFIVVIYLLIKMEFISILLPLILMNYGLWFLTSIFMLRAIGDFKYVGFFKKIKQTNFGKLDTKYYSPLCLLLGILMLLIETMT